MTVLGFVFAAIGAVLAFNVIGSADRLAAFSRPFPAWLKGIGADYPVTHRILGTALLLVGIGLAVAGLINRR
jgi:hypothetical protein